MMDLKAFLQQNKAPRPNVFYPVTASLKDGEGKPLLWELRHLNTACCEAIKRDCTFAKEDRDGVIRERLDTNLYMDRLLCAAVVMPQLNNAELQDSYGVYTPEELLKAMVDDMGEYTAFSDYVFTNLIGFTTFESKVEQAKN